MMKKRLINNTVTLFLLISMVVGAFSTPVYAREEKKESDKVIVVSLGDSYSSGEGIEKFYKQDLDNSIKVNEPDWLAHRSENSWSGQLTVDGGTSTLSQHKEDGTWFFVAASGAVTDNLLNPFVKEYNRGKYEGKKSLDPQLDIFKSVEKKYGKNAVDYVTISIGGNDVDFSGIITKAVVTPAFLEPGSLSKTLNNTWDDFYAQNGIKEDIKNAYIDICNAAGPQAHVIVAGYPKLLDEGGAGSSSAKGATIINNSVSRFNLAISEIVHSCQDAGYNISFVSVEEAFDGHEAYTSDPYINEVNLLVNPLQNKTEDLKDYMVASAYSIHPNYTGATKYAQCVQAEIDSIQLEEKDEITDMRDPSDDESEAKGLHYGGVVLNPEDVVLKMFDALQEGDYEEAVECLDPATEQQFDFWGGILSSIYSLFTGEYISWGQLALEAAGATDVEVIDCYSNNYVYDTNLDLIAKWVPRIPGLRDAMCTEADVYVKYRCKYEGDYKITEEVCHVRRYEWSGWRIEEEK